MLLDVYVKEFNLAFSENNVEEMLFQLHQMIQRDPLDQQQIILQLIRKTLHSFPNIEYKDGFSILHTSMGEEEAKKIFGMEMYLFESQFCEEKLLRIQALAKILIQYGVFDRVEYPPIQKTAPSVVPQQTETNNFQQDSSIFLPWRPIVTVIVIGVGLWLLSRGK